MVFLLIKFFCDFTLEYFTENSSKLSYTFVEERKQLVGLKV